MSWNEDEEWQEFPKLVPVFDLLHSFHFLFPSLILSYRDPMRSGSGGGGDDDDDKDGGSKVKVKNKKVMASFYVTKIQVPMALSVHMEAN